MKKFRNELGGEVGLLAYLIPARPKINGLAIEAAPDHMIFCLTPRLFISDLRGLPGVELTDHGFNDSGWKIVVGTGKSDDMRLVGALAKLNMTCMRLWPSDVLDGDQG